MYTKITSIQNQKIKELIGLEKSRERKRQQLFIVEGKREIEMAIEAGYIFDSLFFCDELISDRYIQEITKKTKSLIPVSRQVFDKIAIREESGGMVATGKMRSCTLDSINLEENPLLLILEGVEKPGNLGAILRTADAARVDAVIVCDPQTDLYNPNVIRSSLGCVFTTQTVVSTSTETIRWLNQKQISIYCTYLKASKSYYQTDFTKPSAIVMGTESKGLTEEWVRHSSENIIIPMLGKIDSMNVSTAAAVVVFEAKRQRNFSI